MSRTSAVLLLVAASLASCAPSADSASGAEDPVVEPGGKVLGRDAAAYSILWWQWAMSMPSGMRAYEDPDGSRCATNQSGNVWFLAGTSGSSVVQRRCTVPPRTYLFFPVINMLYYSPANAHHPCDRVRAGAAANNDALQYAIVKIDGKPVPDVRRFRVAAPECFDVFADASYVRDSKAFYPAASDGFWLMLKPLSPGEHHISVRANYANPHGDRFGEMVQYFDYDIDVRSSAL